VVILNLSLTKKTNRTGRLCRHLVRLIENFAVASFLDHPVRQRQLGGADVGNVIGE